MKHTLTLIMLFVVVGSWGQNTKHIDSNKSIQWGDITSYSVSNHGRNIVNITKDMIYVVDDSSRIICTIKYDGNLQWASCYDSFKHYTPLLFKKP